MNNFYKALLAAILLPSLSFAQSNYKPGYVVSLKGDTTRGFIDYREWSTNPNAISFKKALADNKAREFTPAEISFFTISGLESYRRYQGPISMDIVERDHLANTRDTSFRVDAVFFKELQRGKNLALYAYSDNVKVRFFIAEAPTYSPIELVFRLHRVYGGVTETENTYMKQLFALVNKYEGAGNDLQWDIEHAAYNSDDIFKIVSKINHISKKQYNKENAAKGPAFNVFVGAGINIDNISVPTSTALYNAGGRAYTSIKPQASVGVNFFANRSTRQLQFRFEGGIAQSQYKSLYDSKVYPYIPFKASFDETIFTLTPQIIYNFYNAENFKVYIGVGVSLSWFKYSNAYLGSQSQPNTADDIQANLPHIFNTSDNVFMFKAGVQFSKHLGFYGQYVTNVLISKNDYYGYTSVRELVGLNYFFN